MLQHRYKMQIHIMLMMLAIGLGWSSRSYAYEVSLGDRFTLEIHGFLSQGYLKSDENNFLAETEDGTFDFREYGLNVSTYLTDQLFVGAQVFGRDFGEYGNNEPALDWAFADLYLREWIGFRAGRMKLHHGLYNEVRDIDVVRTSIFLPESIYNDSWRESFTALNGVGIYGTLSSEKLGSLSYQAQWGKITIDPDGGFENYLNEFLPREIETAEVSDIYVAGIEINPTAPLDGLRMRWTWNNWDMNDEGVASESPVWQAAGIPAGLPMFYYGDFDVTVVAAEYRWRDLVLTAESFMPVDYTYDLSILDPQSGTIVKIRDGAGNNPGGFYVGASYSFTEWFELGMLYSEFYNSTNDKDGRTYAADTGKPRYNVWLKDLTLTSRFNIHENWVIKAEGHAMDGTDIMLNKDNPDGMEQHWFLFGCKVTYNF